MPPKKRPPRNDPRRPLGYDVLEVLAGALLQIFIDLIGKLCNLSPMRWSEDFGHYLHRCRGAFFGVGAGEDHPQIHTEHYEYPDTLLEPTVEAFRALLTSE